MYQRSLVKLNAVQLTRNYEICLKALADGQKPIAVIKANAYGHGAVAVANILYQAGCRHFAVADLEEAVELRKHSLRETDSVIIVLGYISPQYVRTIINHNVVATLVDEENAEAFAEAIREQGLNPKDFHAEFALDSGMNRIGLDIKDEAHRLESEKIIRKYASVFSLEGVFTHLCKADDPNEEDVAFTQKQQTAFQALCESVADLNLPMMHCQNSAATLFHRPYGNFVRLGIVLYGLKPYIENTLPKGLKPTLSWDSMVTHVHTVAPGESIGYGHGFNLPSDAKPMQVATVSIGYADGYHRALSNRGKVYIDGQPAPIVGRVCMDQMMVDVTGLKNVKVGAEAELIGPHYSADEMASDAGTIGYEIVCNIAPRAKENYEITHNSL